MGKSAGQNSNSASNLDAESRQKRPASILYDYYNDEAKAILAPLKFVVR
ncbi:MAG: hypothetical protein R2681_05035 [Pyrinomonadaceae bacterium]